MVRRFLKRVWKEGNVRSREIFRRHGWMEFGVALAGIVAAMVAGSVEAGLITAAITFVVWVAGVYVANVFFRAPYRLWKKARTEADRIRAQVTPPPRVVETLKKLRAVKIHPHGRTVDGVWLLGALAEHGGATHRDLLLRLERDSGVTFKDSTGLFAARLMEPGPQSLFLVAIEAGCVDRRTQWDEEIKHEVEWHYPSRFGVQVLSWSAVPALSPPTS